MGSIKDIPQDEATKKKILDIIDHQFNLEIYLKHRETSAIRREITKAEETLRDLELAIKNETSSGSSSETPHYTRRSAAVVANAMFQTLMPSLTDSKKIDKSLYRGQGLYGRRSDGVFVRLSCPACKRDDFANQQGFLNHCRLAHNLEFGPYEQIMLRCGTPVDESEVPLDHPIRLRPVTRPVPPVRPKRKERPTIKVFEEDVDLESDRLPKQDNQQRPTREASKSLPETTDLSVQTKTDAKKDEDEGEKIEQHSQPEEQGQQPMESIAAAVSIPTDTDLGSRFYIKRQIIVGNVSKYIPPEKRDSTLKNFTHKWMVYVVEPPQMQEISKFVTAVRFHLHPSYKPLDVVDVMEPPFRLTRLGWGEFPIRIQLFFVDNRRNKSVDIIHQVKLDYTHSGKQTPGGERMVEIELDRNTDFEDTSNVPRAPKLNDTSAQDAEASPSTTSLIVKKQKMALLHGMLKEGVRQLPIIRPASQAAAIVPLPYTCATSTKTYFSWSIGRRKALEWHRAHLLRHQVQKQAFDTMDEVLKQAAASLTTKDIVLWCREHRYTPERSEFTEEDMNGTGFGFCKFCGCLRDRHGTDDIHCRWRPKGWSNTRKRGITTMSSVSQLLKVLPSGWDCDPDTEDMDVDIDIAVDTSESKKLGDPIFAAIRDKIVSGELTRDEEDQIDWIWSTVGQLRLGGVIANNISQDREGNLRGPSRDFDISAAVDQRLHTGSLLVQSARVFLKRILQAGVDVYNDQQATEKGGPKEKLLAPMHIHEGIQRVPNFDFLCNQYMGPPVQEDGQDAD